MDYHAFIVRVKQDGSGRPHGFVSNPRTGEKRPFHTAAELLDLLQERSSAPPPTLVSQETPFAPANE
jgi:hypothetical protein